MMTTVRTESTLPGNWHPTQPKGQKPEPQDYFAARNDSEHLESSQMAQDRRLAVWARGGVAAPAAALPAEFTLEVNWHGRPFRSHVTTRSNGTISGPQNYALKGVTFDLPGGIECAIQVSLERGMSNPQAAVEGAVQEHAKAMMNARPEEQAKVPGEYTVHTPQQGQPVVTKGTPVGQYDRPDGVPPFEVVNRPGNGVRPVSGSQIEIKLSSGVTVRSTRDQSQKARTLAAKITFVLGDDGRESKASAALVEKVAGRLAAFSSQDLQLLEENDYRVVIVSTQRTPKGGYPGARPGGEVNANGSWTEGTQAYARSEAKVIVIPESSLEQKVWSGREGENDVLIHELGHAISDCRLKDSPLTGLIRAVHGVSEVKTLDNNPQIGVLFQAYAKRCGYDTSRGRQGEIKNPDAVWSAYACQGAQEYLAEGVAAFKQAGTGRDRLKAKDENFFALLERMFPESADRCRR